VRTRSLVALGLMLALTGCRSGAQDEAADDEHDEHDEPDPVPTPRFTDPENLSKVVYADRDEPIELGIADAREDLWVEIDGNAITPSPGGVIERIGEDRLQLRVEGSMVALLHEVVLAQADGADTLRSEPLILGIVGSKLGSIVANADQDLGLADHVGARGLVLGQLVGETLMLRRGESVGDPWVSVELPGITSDPHSWSVIVEADEPWLAWRIATPNGDTAISMRIGEAGEIQTLWRTSDPEDPGLLGTHEYASLDAVAWIGRTLVISSQAIRDVERATPGDRALLLRRIDPSGEPLDPQLVHGEGQRDIDSLTPILDLAPDAEPRMLIRLARALPWSLGVSASGLPVIDEEPAAIELADDLRWLGSFDGAFGSRQAVWLSGDGLRLGVLAIDRSLDRSRASEVSLPGPPTGPLALAVLAGVPTIVIPRGADQPMQVVRSTGAELDLAELPGPSCDEVALLVSLAGSSAGTLPFTCLSAGALRLGTLATAR
jgi:hypothetical protein